MILMSHYARTTMLKISWYSICTCNKRHYTWQQMAVILRSVITYRPASNRPFPNYALVVKNNNTSRGLVLIGYRNITI